MADDIERRHAAALRAQHVAALRRERSFYVARGERDNVAAVDKSLKALGEPIEDAAESAPRQRAVPKRKTTS